MSEHEVVVELISLIKAGHRLEARGGGSKPALYAAVAKPFDTTRLSGIVEYDPGEYTITALAGTPLREIEQVLAANGQYLPFDPLFVAQGATLGGTIAANTAGSGRYRYGGVRDFLIGVKFVDGQGNLIQGGGKVVKNASGFDFPKFFVGSLGRYGILVETCWKVFPRFEHHATMVAHFDSLNDLQQASRILATSPLEMDTQDWVIANGGWQLEMRLNGLASALPARLERLKQLLHEQTAAQRFETVDGEQEAAAWRAINGMNWQPDGTALVKIPLNPTHVPQLEAVLGETARRYTAAGNVAWVATAAVERLAQALNDLLLTGLVVRGADMDEPIIGRRRGLPLAQKVKAALDPHHVFGERC